MNNASFVGNYTDFYGRNDLGVFLFIGKGKLTQLLFHIDMLEIGNANFTLEEQRSHFTLWALNKSPLLIGTDITKLPNDTIDIFLNKEIIAINQDNVISKPVQPFFWGKNPDHTFDP